MSRRRVISGIIIVFGIVLLLCSKYIMNQVEAGKEQISSGQSNVNTANQLFSLNPTSKVIGKGLTGGAQQKIDEGQQQVAYYTEVASVLKVSGYIVILLGIGFLVLFGLGKK